MAVPASVYSSAFKGDVDAVKAVFDAMGAADRQKNINALSKDRQQSVLYIAARGGHLDLVHYCIETCGADMNKRNGKDAGQSTPLHGAAYGGHSQVLTYLLLKGAVMKKNAYGETVMDNAKDPAEDVSAVDKKKCIAAIEDELASPTPAVAPPVAVAAKAPALETSAAPAAAVTKAETPKKEATVASPAQTASPAVAVAPVAAPETPAPTPTATTCPTEYAVATLMAKPIAALRSLCSANGLPTAGTKAALAKKLNEHHTVASPVPPSAAIAADDSSAKSGEDAEKVPAAAVKSDVVVVDKPAAPKTYAPWVTAKKTATPAEEAGGGGDDAPSPKKAKTEVAAAAPVVDGATPGDADGPLSEGFIAQLKAATFTKEEVEKDTEEFWALEEKVMACCQGRNDDYVKNRLKKKKKPLTFIVKKAWKVKNETLDKAFEAKKAEIVKTRGPAASRVRTSFHGSNEVHLDSILKTALLRFKHPLNPCKEQADDGYFGTNRKGVYVSRYFDYTLKYSNGRAPLETDECVKIIMFRTLPGSTFHVASLNMGMEPTPGYDSHSSPSHLEWYLVDERQLAPDYVLEIQAKEDTRTAADDE